MTGQYTVHPIDENTFAIEEKSPLNQGLCYLLTGTEKALLIDTGFGYNGLADTVKRLTALPVIVANTHAHVDHIGGNHYFDEIWYHELDKGIFALHTNPAHTFSVAAADMPRFLHPLVKLLTKKMLAIDTSGNYHYFDDTHIFHLGGRDVEVIPTPGHTPGSVCFLDRANRQLFSGDTVCEWGILLHLPGEGEPPAVYLESMERLKDLSDAFDSVWPGHHGFPVDKSYIDDYLTCAQRIVDGTAAYTTTKGRRCAQYGRVLITVPDEVAAHG